MTAGQLLVESFPKLLTGSNRRLQRNFTDTPTKMNSKFFTISLTQVDQLTWLSWGQVLQRLRTSILGIECTPSMVDAPARPGLGILHVICIRHA